MIHSLLCDSSSTTATAAKLIPRYICSSTLSSYVNRSFISSFMGLKWSKGASGNKSRQRFSAKVRQGGCKTAYVHGRHAGERVLEEEAPEMLDTSGLSLKVSHGQAYPLGVSEVENGINFAIFSQHATSFKLCLSLPEREEHDLLDGGMIEVTLDPHVNRTGDIWYISVEDIPRSSVLYGCLMDGPLAWHQGHRFYSNMLAI